MERIFFCGDCRTFFFVDCDDTEYTCKCSNCGSSTTITCNTYVENYNARNDQWRKEFITRIKCRYLTPEDIINEQQRIYKERHGETNEERKIRLEKTNSIIVTTGDLKRDYEVLGPVYYQINNRGIFGGELIQKIDEYKKEIESMKATKLMSKERIDWGWIYGNFSIGENNFEKAFFIATQEIKKRAYILGADAVICMRQDIDIETEHINNFYLQMYGTAVKLL